MRIIEWTRFSCFRTLSSRQTRVHRLWENMRPSRVLQHLGHRGRRFSESQCLRNRTCSSGNMPRGWVRSTSCWEDDLWKEYRSNCLCSPLLMEFYSWSKCQVCQAQCVCARISSWDSRWFESRLLRSSLCLYMLHIYGDSFKVAHSSIFGTGDRERGFWQRLNGFREHVIWYETSRGHTNAKF